MSKIHRQKVAAVVALILIFAACYAYFAFAGSEKSITDIPAEVKSTIEKYSDSAKITEIELERHNEDLIYDVEIIRDGKKIDFMVSREGEFLGYENEDDEDENEGYEDDNDDGDDDD